MAVQCQARGDIDSTERRQARRGRNCHSAGSGQAGRARRPACSSHQSTSISMATSAPRTCRLAQSSAIAINGGQRVRRDHRPPPANHVAIIAVMGRLYQHKRENTGSRIHANAYSAATDATVGWTKTRVSQLVSAASRLDARHVPRAKAHLFTANAWARRRQPVCDGIIVVLGAFSPPYG